MMKTGRGSSSVSLPLHWHTWHGVLSQTEVVLSIVEPDLPGLDGGRSLLMTSKVKQRLRGTLVAADATVASRSATVREPSNNTLTGAIAKREGGGGIAPPRGQGSGAGMGRTQRASVVWV